MIKKFWQLKSMFVLLGLFVAFAACVKEKDPIESRNELKDVAGAIMTAVSSGNLGDLNKYFVQPPPEGNGPNRLLSLLMEKADSTFIMYKRRFNYNTEGGTATVSFTFTNEPEDTNFAHIHFVDDNGWKVNSFDVN